MARHELKIWTEYFDQVRDGYKTAEVRLDDRDYCSGDTLVLKEWKKNKKRFTGRQIEAKVVGITRLGRMFAHPVLADWVVLHMVRTSSVGCKLREAEV